MDGKSGMNDEHNKMDKECYSCRGYFYFDTLLKKQNKMPKCLGLKLKREVNTEILDDVENYKENLKEEKEIQEEREAERNNWTKFEGDIHRENIVVGTGKAYFIKEGDTFEMVPSKNALTFQIVVVTKTKHIHQNENSTLIGGVESTENQSSEKFSDFLLNFRKGAKKQFHGSLTLLHSLNPTTFPKRFLNSSEKVVEGGLNLGSQLYSLIKNRVNRE